MAVIMGVFLGDLIPLGGLPMVPQKFSDATGGVRGAPRRGTVVRAQGTTRIPAPGTARRRALRSMVPPEPPTGCAHQQAGSGLLPGHHGARRLMKNARIF